MLDEDLSLADMPVEVGKNFELIVNEEFAEAVNIDASSIQID